MTIFIICPPPPPRPRPGPRRIALAAALAAALAVPATSAHSGQLVDSGAFRLFVDGDQVGTEEFTIHRMGSGEAQRTFATSQVAMADGRVFRTALEMVGPELAVAAYQVSLTGSRSASVEVLRSGDRILATFVEPGGERVREYRADPGAVIVERQMAHHYSVLRRFAAPGDPESRLQSFSPLADDPESVLRIVAEPRSLEHGGTTIEATRVGLGTAPDAGAAWFDGSGRLVRVELPRSGFLAVRIP